MPFGVHGSGPGSPSTSLPRLTGVQTVGVLVRVDQRKHALRVQAGRQRQLHDVAGARRIGVQLGDDILDLLLAGVGGQVPADADDADLRAVPVLARPRRTGCRGRHRPAPCRGRA